MNPFYNNEENKAKLFAAFKRWEGTPFHARARVCGFGVDCVNLVAALYIESGFHGSFNFPEYSMDGGIHDDSSKVVEYVESLGKFELLNLGATAPAPGDLICFKLGRVEYHTGVALSNSHFAQVFQGAKVGIYPIADSTWKKRISKIYRPIA